MPVIDRDNLRQQLRHQTAGAIFELLDRAVAELTDAQLRRVIADHIDPQEQEIAVEMRGKPFSLAAIQRFLAALDRKIGGAGRR